MNEVLKKVTMYIVTMILFASMFSTVFVTPVNAQEIPKEETVYITSDIGILVTGWNPMLPTQAWGYSLMYPALFLYSQYSDEWIPYAAESYRWVDIYTLEVKIRPEAKWWDGNAITADDVKYTFELGKKYTVGWSGVWDYIEEVKVVDEKTVQLITSKEKLNYFQLLSALTGQTILIMPKHRWEALEEELGAEVISFLDDDPEKIVGAGPYKLLQYGGDLCYYIRVDDWWGKDIFGLPKPKYIGQKAYKDNVAAALGAEAGEMDICTHFFASVWEMWEVKGLPIRTYYANPPYYIGGDFVLLYLNYAKYPLSDPNVRRAVAFAIPYDDVISRAYFNYSIRASPSLIIHTVPAYAELIDEDLLEEYMYNYNITEAKRILDEANITDRNGDGWREMPDGTKLGPYTIQVPYGWTDWMMMCDMIAVELKKIGIDAVTEFPDFTVWWDRLIKGTFDIVISWDAGVGLGHPWNTFRWVMDPRQTGPVGEDYPAANWERYTKWEVVPLIDAVAKETDPAKAKDAYRKLQEYALKDLPGIALFYGAVWYEYTEFQWVGWPREENGLWFANMWTWPSNLPVLFYIAPKGETPTVPDWVTDLKFSSSKIFEDLAEAPPPALPVVTVTETVTNTVTTEITTEVPVPTMDVTSIAGAGVIALIVGVAVGWLVASRRRT